jgi:hypothetical protein
MNYYTLPKINNRITIAENKNINEMKPYISKTLINYYDELKKEIILLCDSNSDNSETDYDNIIKIVNPYEYIFSKVPGSNFSVSKLKPKSIMFYDLLEIFHTLNLLNLFNFDIMNSLIVGKNYEDSLECLEILRENYNEDKFFCFYEYNSTFYSLIEKTKFNFIIYEIDNCQDLNQYCINLVEILIIILKFLKENSFVILKIDNIFYKPIIDVVYILCSFFEKINIIKPTTSNIINSDKYIILQNLKLNHYTFDVINNYIISLNNIILNYNKNLNIHNIVDSEIPHYFLNKIDDINIIIGQQQLEALNQIINILKNKNKSDKIECMKKNCIEKSINWCEKYKIPYNKFLDKINIFLPIVKDKEKTNYTAGVT